ncbi:type VI secretion system membrane subunit TssM [Vibrio sp. S4M6]|uniref:type VI secretion system membrane subunit TssM n=1 Tax=Vibrio sinus TaxID=2946865 RepID=UPI00202A0383|nr:type VI secretion system membrane subunit TssM [Vibrio sinus]MCL9780080.1 type VI secretion system membrane subunit TssM [Vibrio sinus]
MIKIKYSKSTVITSLLLTLFAVTVLIVIYAYVFPSAPLWTLLASISVVVFTFALLNWILWKKGKNTTHTLSLESESDALIDLLTPLLLSSIDKPIYLILGTIGAGKSTFLYTSNAIKPIDHTRTNENDYFKWFESEEAIYIEPSHPMVHQEHSQYNAELWTTFIKQIVQYKPRKPIAGCMVLVDFEYLILNEAAQVEYTLSLIRDHLTMLGDKTQTSLPTYLILTKLDKLDGFKEYVHYSPVKSWLEYFSINFKHCSGNLKQDYHHCYQKLRTSLETYSLDASSLATNNEEKKSIIGFAKQFELCEGLVYQVVESFHQAKNGVFYLDLRELFFVSNLQSGRKYNLLAKSCSHYFNVPVIASEHTQLIETPYFTRFLVQSQILPESDYSRENQGYLKKIQRKSYMTIVASLLIVSVVGFFLIQTLSANLHVINQLLSVSKTQHRIAPSGFNQKLIEASSTISPRYKGWTIGNEALRHEKSTMLVSRLKDSTSIAYQSLIDIISTDLMPTIEQGYRKQLDILKDTPELALPMLKGYLMLKSPEKRNLAFLQHQTQAMLSKQGVSSALNDEVMNYLTAYFKTPFHAVGIDMELVRSIRRALLAQPNSDLVYAELISQTKQKDIGTLNLKRAIGFSYNAVFSDNTNDSRLEFSKVYTDTGFKTFYKPQVDQIAKAVTADDWVLGLSNNVIPSDDEQQSFKDKVRQKYIDDYISHWRKALSELKVKRFNNIMELNNAVDLISGPSSPFSTALRLVYNNTAFSPTNSLSMIKVDGSDVSQSVTDQVADTIQNSKLSSHIVMKRVERSFSSLNQLQNPETDNAPTPWEETTSSLSRLRTYLKEISDAPNPQLAALSAARSRMKGVESDPIIQLKQIAIKSPEPVKSWLLSIVRQSWSVVVHEAAEGIQSKWDSEVYSKYRQIGLNKYPFSLSASEEISIDDFEQLFSSGGILDEFIQNNLAPFYDTNLWTAKKVEGQVLPLTPAFLVQLRNYTVIKNTLINKATNRFYLPFNTKVLDLDSSAIRATINLSDSPILYYQGPSKVRELHWPPSNGNFSSSITIQDITAEGKQHVLSENGQWALFRLIGNSTISNVKDGSFTSEINVAGRKLSLNIHPLTTRNPFTLSELYNFNLPKTITL